MPKRFSISIAGMFILSLIMALGGNVHAAPKKDAAQKKATGKTKSPAVTAMEAAVSAPSRSRPLLDTNVIRKLYLDGDFDQAIEILETGMKERRPYDHGDSVFIFKHLGVMYAAKYDTREKGKYYMHQLLMTEPTARIMDMYASDMIYMIFKNIQDEFESTRGKLGRAENHVRENSQPGRDTVSTRPKEGAPRSNSRALVWIGATSAVVVAGVAAYFIFEDEPKTVTKNSSFE